MTDSDVLVNIVPFSVVQLNTTPEDAPEYIVGLIRNILVLSNDESADITVTAFKDGITFSGQKSHVSFRWSIHENGESYLKAWGMRPCKTWDWLKRGKRVKKSPDK